ncbi:MAG TPA: type II secretion system protein [Candidatus Omnitrophota bacterium]|nr:type II secretion system protein [Candidatus Omnitrophota bacterium]
MVRIGLVKDVKGLTLVEVIVAIALVALIIASVGSAIVQASVFSASVDIAYTAAYLAQRRIDVLKRFDFNQLHPGAEETDVRVDSGGNVSSTGEYLRTTEVVTDYNSNPYLIQVKVSIKRIKINADGTIIDPVAKTVKFLGNPFVVETLFVDLD